ncbi:hypothetical protein ONZ45_g342 [Pleurotus djamor]|nr:hypothetical protein ONZ45_g342 [Pleurotus djamor]
MSARPSNPAGQAKVEPPCYIKPVIKAPDYNPDNLPTLSYSIHLRDDAPRLEILRDLGIKPSSNWNFGPGQHGFFAPLTDEQLLALRVSPHVETIRDNGWGMIPAEDPDVVPFEKRREQAAEQGSP